MDKDVKDEFFDKISSINKKLAIDGLKLMLANTPKCFKCGEPTYLMSEVTFKNGQIKRCKYMCSKCFDEFNKTKK